jgi:hypothetical protein
MRINRIAIAAVAVIASLAIAAPAFAASAQRPQINPDRAASVVMTQVREEVARDNERAAEHNTELPDAAELQAWIAEGWDAEIVGRRPLVVDVSLEDDDVDLESRYRALADVEYRMDDGTTTDDTFEVIVTKRDYYRVRTVL